MTTPHFTLQPLDTSHLSLLLDIQEQAFKTLENKCLLRHNSPEMLLSCLQEPNRTLGAWTNDQLVAFSILYIPQTMEEDLAHYVTDTACQGLTSANNKLCIVRPQYRGQKLQLLLGKQIELEARARGIEMLCATASPENTYSCNNLLAQGYTCNQTLSKYGYPRNLYYKILTRSIQ